MLCEPAQVSQSIQITKCIQTDGSAYVSTCVLIQNLLCVKYPHTHKYRHTPQYRKALGYAALWEVISLLSGLLPPSHYLLHNQLWFQNNLIPLTALCCCYAG